MAIQMTGMASGLDTESMIQDLVTASSSKKTKLEGEQTKVEWKQKIWDELNTDIYSFYSKTLENLKWESAYSAKKTTVADESIASVVSAENAINGTQTLAVKQLAATGYLTGAKINNAKTTSTMADLGILADGESGKITINGNDISISSTTTIKSLVSQLNNSGVVANFDETNQRFFISAKASGKDNDFSLTASDSKGMTVLSKLGLLSTEDINSSEYSDLASLSGTDYDNRLSEDAQKLAEEYFAKNKALKDANDDFEQKITDAQTDLDNLKSELGQAGVSNDDISTFVTDNIDSEKAALEALKAEKETLVNNGAADDVIAAKDAEITAQEEKISKFNEVTDLLKNISDYETTIDANDLAIEANAKFYVEEVDGSGNKTGNVTASSDATNKAKTALDASIQTAKDAIKAVNDNIANGLGAVRVIGKNAKILLNGAEFESNSNTFSVNGMTITAKGVSEKNADGSYKTTSLTTDTDVDAIYKKIVTLFDKYNELLTKFDTKYNADSAKDYDMLTKDQKEDMTDDEVENWENKIKDSLLRRDDNLETLISTFESAMNKAYTINGKKYTLSSFGIETLSYFDSAEHEKNNLHVAGNPDDENTSEDADKLKKALAENPEDVTKFFSQLFSDFYSTLNTQAKSTDYRTRNKFYDDKMLQTNYDDYKTKISDQQTYLDNLETRYRSQFTAMEKAMTTLNSQTSSLSGLLGS